MVNPAVQKSGRGAQTRDDGVRRKTSACSQNCRVGARWRCSIPFGVLVVPELNWMRPGSPGPMAAARAATAGGVGPAVGQQAVPARGADRGAPAEEREPVVVDHRRHHVGEVGREQACLGQHPGDRRALEQDPELGGGREGGEGDGHAAGEGDPEDGGDHLGAVAHDDGDPGRVADPHGDQAGGDGVGLTLEVGVGPADGGAAEEGVVEDEGLSVGVGAPTSREEPAEGQRTDGGALERWPLECRHRPAPCDANLVPTSQSTSRGPRAPAPGPRITEPQKRPRRKFTVGVASGHVPVTPDAK